MRNDLTVTFSQLKKERTMLSFQFFVGARNEKDVTEQFFERTGNEKDLSIMSMLPYRASWWI
jgi:plasmid replication initiation protein